MSILQSIWNGPFHVGKLAQPISVGDVLLKILEVMWRLIISIIALGAFFAGYITYIHPKLFPPLKNSITAEAFYAADMLPPPPPVKTVVGGNPPAPTLEELERSPCSKDYPIRISLYNKGSETLTDVRFQLEGFKIGYSTNYLQYESMSNDSILNPGFGATGCYAVRTKDQTDPKQLYYKVDVWSASEVGE